MRQEAFEIANLEQEGPRRWLVDGRAYTEINLNTNLTTSSLSKQGLRVIEIITYGKRTDGLAAMMTGRLLLEGELHLEVGRPKFLYIEREEKGEHKT